MDLRILYLLAVGLVNVCVGGRLAHLGFGAMLRADGTGEGMLALLVGAFGLLTAAPGAAALALLRSAPRLERRAWRVRAVLVTLAAAAPLAVIGAFGWPG